MGITSLKKLATSKFVGPVLGAVVTLGAMSPAFAGDGKIEYHNLTDSNDITVKAKTAQQSADGNIAISVIGGDDTKIRAIQGVAQYIESKNSEDVSIVQGRTDAPKILIEVYYDGTYVGEIKAGKNADIAQIQNDVFQATETARSYNVTLNSSQNEVELAQN